MTSDNDGSPHRAVVVTTDPLTLPAINTWYLITNLLTVTLAEIVRLYGLRTWVEQSYKQVKTTLGWAHYQVRSDTAIRRHRTLVCCTFTFCWWQAADSGFLSEQVVYPSVTPAPAESTPKKTHASTSPNPILAVGPTPRQSLARTLPYAQALLARLLDTAPSAALATTP